MRMTSAIGLLAALAVCGCQADQFTEVSGTVSLDGKPLAEGEIILMAADRIVTPSAGKVVDGQFRCRAIAGPKKVQINSTRDTGRTEHDGWPIRESIIPTRYNTMTELTVEVKRGGPNEFSFELTSKR